ncbi:hypothetical protein MVEN_00081400 [Mycena venus]|uniref:Uncharacterized protein n=1 Tax=Mycena venus TaxID=2733690 RepID=A0A8H7DF96_9AGAR|nr:hypothetical protein MVEN_00081400 [Mycena venus]
MPPWNSMATPEGARELIKERYLPPGLGLKDLSRMVKEEVKKIYKLWFDNQKSGKLPLKFKVAEAKKKQEEDQQVKDQNLKRKKPVYVEVGDGSAQEAERNDDDSEEEEKWDGKKKKTAVNTKPTAGDKAVKTKNLATESSAAGQNSAGNRAKPRPVITTETQFTKLLELSQFAPYRSPVQDVLRSSMTTAPNRCKGRTPSWCSWDIKNVELGAEFFDITNNKGYLAYWTSVVEWMEGNPHIPAENSELSHAQASDILLIVGLTYHTAKQCAECDPDSPLYTIPFTISDLDKVEAGIKNMLTQTKKALKFGVGQNIHCSIENSWKKFCLEVGLSEGDIRTFGKDWKTFVKTYAAVDSALVRRGKPSQLHAPHDFPEALQMWSQAKDADGNIPGENETDWAKEMQHLVKSLCDKVALAEEAQNVDNILDEDWCQRGKGGLVCIVLGMKWWRTSFLGSKDKHQLETWSVMLTNITETFKVIMEAYSIKHPKSHRS